MSCRYGRDILKKVNTKAEELVSFLSNDLVLKINKNREKSKK
jgi:hypothetical protein